MIFKIVDSVRQERKISKMDFYKAIGVTQSGYKKMLEKNDLKVSTLVKIAEVLGVGPAVFFEVNTPVLNLSNESNKDQELINIYRQLTRTQTELQDCKREKEELQSQKTVPVVSAVQKLKGK